MSRYGYYGRVDYLYEEKKSDSSSQEMLDMFFTAFDFADHIILSIRSNLIKKNGNSSNDRDCIFC